MIRIIEWCIEALGWLHIAISPILMGTVLAAICYYKLPSGLNLFGAIAFPVLGMYVGIRWASAKWKTGTINFLSGVKETEPEENKF